MGREEQKKKLTTVYDEDRKEILLHFGIDIPEGSKNGCNISEQTLRTLEYHRFMPVYVDGTKKVQIIMHYDPNYPFIVKQVITED